MRTLTYYRNRIILLFIMKIKASLIKMFPKSLNENELAALLKLAVMLGEKGAILKVTDDELEEALQYGRDRKDLVLTKLVDMKMITRKQVRDEKGHFDVNEIKVITPLISY